MKRALWFSVAALAVAACGGGETKQPDAGPVDNGNPTGFTFAAVGDRSFASFGWMGTFHDLEVPDGTPFGVTVIQPGCDDSGNCPFEGPTKPAGQVNRQRCLNKMRQTCTSDAQCADVPADPTTQRCVFIYDPPTGTPFSGAGGAIGACGWSFIPVAAAGQPATIRGTMNITTGELNIKDMNVIISLNGPSGGYRGACAECIGDGNANDGKAEGVCTHGTSPGANENSPDEGKSCDVHRFGNISGYAGNYSMDCSPTVLRGDQQNAFGGQFTSSGYRVAVTSASPFCSAKGFESQHCLCGMCPDKVGRAPTACLTNADCGGDVCGQMPDGCDPNGMPFNTDMTMNTTTFDPTKQPNQCRKTGLEGWFATAPNSCAQPCNWDPVKGVGSCISTLTRRPVGCYPAAPINEIVAPGASIKEGKVFIVDTATARCTRSFPVAGTPAQAAGAAATNAQLGLPGLTFQKRSFRVIPEHGAQ